MRHVFCRVHRWLSWHGQLERCGRCGLVRERHWNLYLPPKKETT